MEDKRVEAKEQRGPGVGRVSNLSLLESWRILELHAKRNLGRMPHLVRERNFSRV